VSENLGPIGIAMGFHSFFYLCINVALTLHEVVPNFSGILYVLPLIPDTRFHTYKKNSENTYRIALFGKTIMVVLATK
jgi:hypothetical protein